MEFGLWSLVFIVIIVVFKSLKYEKSIYVTNEKHIYFSNGKDNHGSNAKNLLRWYLEIKKLHPDIKLKSLIEWEFCVLEAVADDDKKEVVADRNKKYSGKVVQLHTVNRTHKR